MQAWASSPAGISYALDHIASVARGLRGPAAVNAIVSRFERPADPRGEISRALAGLGGATPPAAGEAAPLGTSVPVRPLFNPAVLQSILDMNRRTVGLPSITLGSVSQSSAQPAAKTSVRPATTPKVRGKTVSFLEHFAAPFGLTITATTNGRHVRGSYHYKGRAVDFAGDPHRMAALAAKALEHPESFAEMFYSGPGNPGAFIKDGKVYPLSQLDPSIFDEHTNHVHLAK